MADIVIKVKTDGGEESLKNINDLKKAISSLEEQASNLDLGSDAFEKSKSQVDELKKKLNELSKSQQQLDDEMNAHAEEASAKRAERMEKVGNDLAKFAAGVTDAFAGAFIAFGAGDEDAKAFNETLQKGLGIAIGVKGGIEALVAGVQLAGPAFEAFNAVMAANPVGAIVVLITALTAGIYLLIRALNKEQSESEKLTEQLEEQKNAHEQLSKARHSEISVMESKISLMKAQGASDAQILKATLELYAAKRKALEQDLVQLELSANITKAKLKEVFAEDSLTEAYYKKMAAAQRAIGQDQAAEIFDKMAAQSKLDRSKEVTDQLLKDLTAVKELKDKLVILDIQRETEVATSNAKSVEKRNKLFEESAKKQAAYLASQQAAYLALSTIVKETNNMAQSIKEADDTIAGEVKMTTSSSLLDKINAMAAERAAKKQSLADINQDLRDALDKQLKSEKLSLKEREDLIRETNKKIEDNNEAAFQKQMADINKYTQAIGSALNSVMGVFQAISDLQKQEAEQDSKERQEKLDANLGALSEAKDLELSKEGLTQDEKTKIQEKYAQKEYELKLQAYNQDTAVKKKAFEQDKKMKIAQTVISTITGAMSALTGMISSIPGPVGIILGALSAAAVVATGAIQIAAINKQKFDAGTPPQPPKISAPSSDIGSGSGDGAKEGPKLYGTGGGDVNTATDAAKRQAQQEPIKAYVVSQEVTSSQNMNAVIERRSSF